MKCIVNGDIVLSQPLEGPLATQIAAFAKWAREQGYARYSRYRQVLLAACFSRWLGRQVISLRRVSSEQLRATCDLALDGCDVHSGDAAALRQFLDFLRRRGVIPAEKIAATPTDAGRASGAGVRAATCATIARWRARPSSITCRSSAGSSPIGSAAARSRSRGCVPATSCDLSSAKPRVCI